MKMKALTIANPYPALICLPETDPRHKRVENRSWATKYRGPLAIHAGMSKDWLSHDLKGNYGIPVEEMVFGAVVAIADLVDCYSVGAIALKHSQYPWVKDHIHTSGRFLWILQTVRPLAKPIQRNGVQGLWNIELPDEVIHG